VYYYPQATLRSVLSGVPVDDIDDRATDGHCEVLRNHGYQEGDERTTQMTVESLCKLWAALCIPIKRYKNPERVL
jgi:hypothetical protein